MNTSPAARNASRVRTAGDLADALDFELYVAADPEMHTLAEEMAGSGLDAIELFDLAAELFALDCRVEIPTVTELPQPLGAEPADRAAA